VPAGISSTTFAQQPPPLVQPPENIPAAKPGGLVEVSDEVPLGRSFESLSAGIAFRPPTDCKMLNEIDGNYLAEWTDEHRDWTLKLGRMVLDRPAPLEDITANFGEPREGILNRTVKNLKVKLPGCIVLRQDVTNTRDAIHLDPQKHPELTRNNVGMIIIRYSDKGRRRLSQQAIIQTSDGVYYLLTLTSPGSAALTADGPVDPAEAQAADTFSRMIDTVRLIDRRAIKIDQDQRLYQSRAAILNWTESKLHNVLIRQQWVRILRNGKDIGYSYITEDVSGGIPKPLTAQQMRDNEKIPNAPKTPQDFAPKGDGVLIGVRTRMMVEGVRSDKTKGTIQTDAASWLYTTLDRKHEDFSRVVVTDDFKAPKKGYLQEFGISSKRVKRFLVRDQEDPKKPRPDDGAVVIQDKDRPVGMRDDWELDVNETSNIGAAEPLTRKLPQFYIPQALGHLLPRLLPLDRPQGYLFATYVSDAREVLLRYVDVLPEQWVTFNGNRERAIPIRDRLGVQGSPTIHYMTIDGRYIGSENQDQKLMMLPTDDTTLARLWKDANLTRPGGVDRGGPANANAGQGH
jgi:hypothetical protein